MILLSAKNLKTIERTEQPEMPKSERLGTEHSFVRISALFGFQSFGFWHSTENINLRLEINL